MPDIAKTHPEYNANKNKWQQISDEAAGEEVIKSKAEIYLPFPVSLPTDITDTDDFKRQYAIYLEGAHYVNYTQQSIEDLVASVFSREPIMGEDFPPELEYLELAQVAREITAQVVAYGRSLLVVDYPVSDMDITKEEQSTQDIAAYYVLYEPLDVINWDTIRVGGRKALSRVVIKIKFLDAEGEYEFGYLELILDNGVYKIRVYDDDENLIGEVIPTASGGTMDYIPAIFVGVLTNDTDVDQPPVMGIANTNIKHYQNTAELQHSINYIGHPMLSITGAPMGFIDEMNEVQNDGSKKRIVVGASQALVIEGETGQAELLQISPDLVHFKQLDQLEKSMAEQGYRLKTDDKAGVESAKSLTIRNSGATSKLANIAGQVEKAIKDSILFIDAYMGTTTPEEWQFDLVKDYLQLEADSQLLSTLDGMVSSGRVPDYVLFDYMVEVELLDAGVDYDILREDSEVADVGLEFNPGTGAPNIDPYNPPAEPPSNG